MGTRSARSTRSFALQPWNRRNRQPVRSLFLREALEATPARTEAAPTLVGQERADVCIVGGGYTGLWAAIRLKELDPALTVVVLEADLCGSGASGRNSGWAGGWWLKFPTLLSHFGKDEAVRLARQASWGIDEIERFCVSRGNQAQFARGGGLWTATCRSQLGAWDAHVEATRSAGLDVFEPLDAAEIRRRLGSDVFLGGVFDRSVATMQPAILARSLASHAAGLGVKIYEGSPVVEIVAGADLEFRCASGSVRAEKGVLAINAWMTHLADVRPYVFAVSSDIVATPPIPERLGQLGYTGREHASNARLMVNYCRTTPDGRLLFGRGGSGTLARGGRIGPSFDFSMREAAEVEQDFRMWFPMLADVPAVDAWSGPIDKSQCGLPWFGALGNDDRIRYAVGYSGAGVAQAVVGGRVVASMVLGVQDEWAATGCTLNRIHGGGRLPPEPIRYIGGRLVQAAVKSKESHEAHGKRPPWLAVQLSRLVPGSEMPTPRAKF